MKINEYLKLSQNEIEQIINHSGSETENLGSVVEDYVFKIALIDGLSDYTLDAIDGWTAEDFAKILGGAKGKAEIELRISQKFYFDKTVVNEYGNVYDVDDAVYLMDDKLKEDIYNELSPCTEQSFFDEYVARHAEKFNEEWELAKANPTW